MTGLGELSRSVIRFAYNFAQRLRLIYWRIFKPRIYGVKVIAVNADGHVLLVRHSYHRSSQWLLPGGGIKRGEPAEAAARRELKEETGLDAGHITLLGVYESRNEGARNQISTYSTEAVGELKIDNIEISEAGFFDPDKLPDRTGLATHRRLAEWSGKKQVSGDW